MVDNINDPDEDNGEQPPPFGKKWSRLYAIVILNHIFIIILFFILTALLS